MSALTETIDFWRHVMCDQWCPVLASRRLPIGPVRVRAFLRGLRL